MNIWVLLISTISGAFIALAGVFLGGWLIFKGKSTGERFINIPKERGAFSINTDESEDFPGTEKPSKDEEHAIERTKTFLKTLGG